MLRANSSGLSIRYDVVPEWLVSVMIYMIYAQVAFRDTRSL